MTAERIEQRKDFYDDGSLEVERTVRVEADGSEVNHGKYIRWHLNGIKAEEGEYENGVRVGRWRSWLDSGRNFFDGDYLDPSHSEKPKPVEDSEPTAMDRFAGAELPAEARGQLIAEIFVVLTIAWLPLMIGLWTLPSASAPTSETFALEQCYFASLHLAVVAAMLLLIAKSGEGWAAFGFSRPNWALDTSVAFVAFLISYEIDSRAIEHVAGLVGPVQKVPALGVLDWIALSLALILNSFAEEIAMRAVLMRRVAQLTRSFGATLVVPALLFASYHAYFGPGYVAVVFIAGLGYGLLYWWLRRIWPLVIAHTLHNLALYALNTGLLT